MMKQNTKLNRIGMVYNLNSIEERKQIMELKSQGRNSREIAEIMNKKIKSIQSVKSEERKSEYKEFQQRMISLVLDHFKDQIMIDMTDKKRLSKQIRKFINQTLPSKQNSELRQLIPQSRKASNQRRIKEKIYIDYSFLVIIKIKQS
ncbi:unnamed protein product (macronuclear) [Paramecium tetraurelia]|uniref:Transposase IS30-like HTH domain-containing protein n=1 Tax=Paramecium tetraurelia TaxID=5888 RepID=A0C525_PARTE|nr:uncharacterized protein GSPATT00006391001 [Paramecium tetraurelia]CAK65892.1 unnamed protein product [Paramecium tetraurelia]|eukprot:XP_001433289.1 hypothetical protein (macronuclear) [Paramecium tetraurelia strain d4-2]